MIGRIRHRWTLARDRWRNRRYNDPRMGERLREKRNLALALSTYVAWTIAGFTVNDTVGWIVLGFGLWAAEWRLDQ